MAAKLLRFPLLFLLAATLAGGGARRARGYDGNVAADVPRDRALAIAADHATLRWYCSEANLDFSAYTGARCFYTTTGWKTGVAYCWGGEDTTAEYLARIAAGAGAGNINTSLSSSYDAYCAGHDCSGYVSQCWTSGRYATSGFSNISAQIAWTQLKRGDAINKSGSHIRLFDSFVADINTILVYESTSGGGALWRTVHRSLPMSDFSGYIPIRYQSTYKMINWPEPDITYVRRTGVERVEIRWDGQADAGFRLYGGAADGAAEWPLLRDTAELPPDARYTEVSGLLPNTTYRFRMTAVNTGGETGPSDVAVARLGDRPAAALIVAAHDRYRQQFGARNPLYERAGEALGALGLTFDFAANEAILTQAVDPAAYDAVVWISGAEATLDETFSWPEQMFLQAYLDAGGRLFASGSEIAWDLVEKGGAAASYKNGHINDSAFAQTYLGIGYSADSAGVFEVAGAAGGPFEGVSLRFDDGLAGAYMVTSPDVLTAAGDGAAALRYSNGGVAGVARASQTRGRGVTFGFPFETIVGAEARRETARRVFHFLNPPPRPPTVVSVTGFAGCPCSTTPTLTIQWEGAARDGFRLWLREGATGEWRLAAEEASLPPLARAYVIQAPPTQTALAVKMQAVNDGVASGDSNTLCAMIRATGPRLLLVEGYDRWQSQGGGAPDTFCERRAEALAPLRAQFDSMLNERAVAQPAPLADYNLILWSVGQESTESETFSAAEQRLLADLQSRGVFLFVSGAEIGWDLVEKAGAANDFHNGSAGDTAFFQQVLRADYLADAPTAIADHYRARGAAGGVFAGLRLAYDNGTGGAYNVRYPDVIAPRAGARAELYYGDGAEAAAISYEGQTSETDGNFTRLLYLAIPFETLTPDSARREAMARAIKFFFPDPIHVSEWIAH